jgi:hypothetical protein
LLYLEAARLAAEHGDHAKALAYYDWAVRRAPDPASAAPAQREKAALQARLQAENRLPPPGLYVAALATARSLDEAHHAPKENAQNAEASR